MTGERIDLPVWEFLVCRIQRLGMDLGGCVIGSECCMLEMGEIEVMEDVTTRCSRDETRDFTTSLGSSRCCLAIPVKWTGNGRDGSEQAAAQTEEQRGLESSYRHLLSL